MRKINFNKILIRASSTDKLMTNGQGKDNNEMGKTAKRYVRQLLREYIYERHEEIDSKYLRKGIQMEEDALTLYSLFIKKPLNKNKERINNKFITGHPDVIIWQNKKKALEGIDIKCPYDIHNMPFKDDELNSSYYWQAQSYMWLTGATKWKIVYCLMNSPANSILYERKRKFEQFNCPEQGTPEYQAYILEATEIEKMHIYSMKEFKEQNPHFDIETPDWRYDIPMDERIVEFTVERSEEDIERLKTRVMQAREYMKTLLPQTSKKKSNAQLHTKNSQQ